MTKDAAAASLTATAAAGVAAPPRCPGASSGGVTNVLASPHTPGGGTGQHTLHVEYAVWSGSYRIIHTKPDGKRVVWRRGIETLEEARLRALVVADICGYEARL